MAFANADDRRAYHREYNKARRANDPEFHARTNATAAANERKRRDRGRALKQRVAMLVGCKGCGFKDPELHYHHPDPSTKVAAVGNMVANWAALKAEMRKCIILCQPCHTEEHRRVPCPQ